MGPAKEQESWVDTEGSTGEFAQFNQKGRKAIEDSEREANGDASKSDGEVNGNGKKSDEPIVIDTKRSEDVAIDIERPTPPFWGTKILQSGDLDLEELFWYMDLQALFAGQWQFRKPKGQSREEYDWFLASKVNPILEEWKEKIRTERWLEPTLVYGYFPCAAIDNSVHVYEPSVIEQGLTPKTATPFVTWTFPRQKSAVAFLEPYMEKIEGEDEDRGKGKFLIATVKGDVHDIGKNLVDIILTNNGYKVVNLGIKQAIEAIVEAHEQHQPDCIAMSGLLVKSTAFMKDNL